jgi:transcriptional regulator with XRE-family HTH domain
VKILDPVFNPREIRRRLGLNQEQFWTQIGVTQSGGSRYESGREMPRPVKELLRLVHEQIDLAGEARRLRDHQLSQGVASDHRNLRRAVKGRQKAGEGAAPFAGEGGIPDDLDDADDAAAPASGAGPIDLPHR